ncbi:MAG: hypothetical protein VCB59_03265 [Gammaproteobacteria bacterium]
MDNQFGDPYGRVIQQRHQDFIHEGLREFAENLELSEYRIN